MSDRLDKLLNAFAGLPNVMEQIAERVVTSDTFTELMLDANREQLQQGMRADDTRIIPEYAESTIARKKRKGQPIDRVTLRDTGTFYSLLRVREYTGLLDIWNHDTQLLEKLVQKYGESILGLTERNLSLLREIAAPEIREQAIAYLENNF